MSLKNERQAAFDNLIFQFDEYITTTTAAALARELELDFDPLDYDS